ncbi:GT-D fold domain-containing glycosyltransferase [Microbacterium sulfonylureivorans]|uniref:GT-D fold domain-containing glycosyltransferase n=1 Tax=Microbacterium sulfonylureivorans TaxID=2486854 RepID=UPI0013E0335F|nr:GT-D fold domain-containing glycosyltransferase [Microbacterium sulfonylureivorans]
MYYFLVLVANLIPGRARRQRFIEWARSRFSQRAIVESALAEQRVVFERTIYRTQMSEAPVIMTVDQTLDALVGGKSIARFGGGDLWTMAGGFELFQKPGSELTRRLEEVLRSDEPDLLVAIPSFTYELSSELSEGMWEYCLRSAPRLRRILNPYLKTGTTYAATEVSLAHSTFGEAFDRESYFEKCRRIWDGERIVIVHGEGIFDGYRHDLFGNASTVTHIVAPSSDAFEHYDDILSRTLESPPGSLVIAILGPTATVLAYDLHRAGYRALDLGHISKSYEWWRTGRSAAGEIFFRPD